MTREKLSELLQHATTSVPKAGKALGIENRNTSYAAAARGQIKTIRIGRLLKVPTAWLREQLGIPA